MRLDDDDMRTTGSGGWGEGPADSGADPTEQDGGADGGAAGVGDPAREGPADSGADPLEQDGGADSGAGLDEPR
ncbi:MAG TPA: hypothetical protein VFB84_13325 [Micromonosporaceae bacterium]|nr:hypothetical protein [Micromonosporaceae bacterium]